MTTVAAVEFDTARAFARRHLPAIELGLARSLADLEPALGALRGATLQAAGVGGPAGHRWRPLLVLAGSEAAGVAPEDGMGAALAVELTHTASLVLDDLPCMDDCGTRRGAAATHRLVGTGGAILAALGLLGRAAELLAAAPRNGSRLCRTWGRVIGLNGMSGGQALDLAARQGLVLRGAARRLYRQKTTALAAVALGAGARAGGAPGRSCAALERFGRDLGWAYQLLDDARDESDDAADGRPRAVRCPRRHAALLQHRAERRLRETPALSPGGMALLFGFAREIVPHLPHGA